MTVDFRDFDKAYNEDIKRRIKEKEEKQTKKTKMSAVRQNIAYVLLFVLFFAVIAKTVIGYVELNTYNVQNVKIKNEIEQLKVEISDLEMQLDEKIKSSIIEKIAKEELGMVFPDETQKMSLMVTRMYTLNYDATSVIVKNEEKQNIVNQ